MAVLKLPSHFRMEPTSLLSGLSTPLRAILATLLTLQSMESLEVTQETHQPSGLRMARLPRLGGELLGILLTKSTL